MFLVRLSMIVMSHFLYKIADLEDILCELVDICVLSEIHVSKTQFKQINENLRLKVYAPCSGNLCTKFHNISFINK